MQSDVKVKEAKGRFVDMFDAAVTELKEDRDAVTDVRERRRTGRPMMPRMTPDNNW
ncbi:hypothetical protein ACQP0C_30910 [Nocardia sp. CA-129566]|uniref:hypothetical protein n=1 Tax=Nocardia sp. CA-129566 TaxID=3239976 RepID=UPI003D96B889